MKFCPKCGSKLPDDARFCINCGQPVPMLDNPTPTVVPAPTPAPTAAPTKTTELKYIIKVFLIIGCVINGLYLLPLCWTIPMTVHYFNSVRDNKPVGVGFKVCSLLFVSLIAGILMLCDSD